MSNLNKILFLFLFFSTSAFGVEEFTIRAVDNSAAKWQNIDLLVSLPASKVSARIKAEVESSGKTLKSFIIDYSSYHIEIPKKVLKKIHDPKLEQIVVMYTPLDISDEDWMLTIHVSYGEWITNDKIEGGGEYSTAEIGVEKNKIAAIFLHDAKTGKEQQIYSSK